VARDGGVFTFGDAGFYGSAHGRARAAVVGLVPAAPVGGVGVATGYWLATRDGGVFTYGDAQFLGTAATPERRGRVVGIAAPRVEPGYWLLTDEGEVVEFGATDHGSPLEAPA
jgi:hypothetical protein